LPATARSVRELCLGILERGDLETKLAPPPAGLGDAVPGPAVRIARPARDPGLEMESGGDKLPRPGELGSAAARAECLARFAHHELMAVELFAWALLRWPELPRALRQGLLAALADEQRHCRLYLERLDAHGGHFVGRTHSDYFWKHEPTLAEAPAGPRAFLSAMGLTLEQANLDFTLVYRDAFRDAGDEESARVCQQVHDDEQRHVRLAAHWLGVLSPGSATQRDAYETAVPFPFAASRAKARRFDAASRRRAGLDDEFIEHVRRARSNPRHPDARDADRS
jgi:uncharacterized ferritin-like protein (DUF455 family)